MASSPLMLGRYILSPFFLGGLSAMVVHEALFPSDVVFPVLTQSFVFSRGASCFLLGRLGVVRFFSRWRCWVSKARTGHILFWRRRHIRFRRWRRRRSGHLAWVGRRAETERLVRLLPLAGHRIDQVQSQFTRLPQLCFFGAPAVSVGRTYERCTCNGSSSSRPVSAS